MSKAKKKDFNDQDINLMWDLLNRKKYTVGQVAKHFNTNKPSISKALGAWNTEEKELENGATGKFFRGKYRIDYKDIKKEGETDANRA